MREGVFYTGSYTGKGKPGIRGFLFEEKSGNVVFQTQNDEVENPSYLCLRTDLKTLYCVSETPGKGSVHSFSILPDGTLCHTGEAETSGGYTCHLSVSRDGKYLASAGFESGDIDVFLLKADGSLGCRVFHQRRTGKSIHPDRQAGPHVHCTAFSPFEELLFVTDLGTDEVICFAYSDTGFSERYRIGFPPGSGPRHILFDMERNDRLYVVCEISYTVFVLETDGESARLIASYDCVAPGFHEYGGSSAIRSGNGRKLYVANRIMEGLPGRDCITAFDITENGLLAPAGSVVCGGNPRDFQIFGSCLMLGATSEGVMEVHPMGENGLPISSAGQKIRVDQISCITERTLG